MNFTLGQNSNGNNNNNNEKGQELFQKENTRKQAGVELGKAQLKLVMEMDLLNSTFAASNWHNGWALQSVNVQAVDQQ